MLKPRKEEAIKAAISLTPEYTKLFRELQKGGGRITFLPEIAQMQNVHGAYVKLYDNELKLGVALMVALLGEAEFKQLQTELKEASIEEQQKYIDEITTEEVINQFSEMLTIPENQQEWDDARKQFNSLPEDERLELSKRGAHYWAYFFGSFFNTLSVMVHGEKLTALVPKAISGDDKAFSKAVQIDRMLLLHHPYFIERKSRAQDEGDTDFIRALANRESTPILNGRIQFPGLYMLFGILESFQWLDSLGATEVLSLCDQAKLDRFQNRIDDADYVRQRLKEYRLWQKTQRLSRI